MKMVKILFLPVVVLCIACGEQGTALRDGYYSAEAQTFDTFGWKEFVTIGVSNGRITTVEYNAKNPSGFIKSWDMEYMRLMDSINGTYPNEYTRFYGEQLLLKQDAGAVDALSGASTSFHSFQQLAGTAIENARAGDIRVSLVTIMAIPKD